MSEVQQPPMLLVSELPPDQQAAGWHVSGQLEKSAGYVRDFGAALDLFDFVQARALENRPYAGRRDETMAAKEERWRRQDEMMRFGGWLMIAAKDGAMTVFHFIKNIQAINNLISKDCPALGELAPKVRRKTLSTMIFKTFPQHEELRHAIAHSAELVRSLEDVKKNALSGGIMLQNNLADRVFFTAIKGRVLAYEISEATYGDLKAIHAELTAAFNDAQSGLRQRRAARLALRQQ